VRVFRRDVESSGSRENAEGKVAACEQKVGKSSVRRGVGEVGNCY
jgi:hypothetical protein